MSNKILNSIITDIENKLESTSISPDVENIWEVFYLWDWIAKISWLRWVSYNEMIEFESWATWVALNLEEHFVWVVVLDWFMMIKEWEKATSTKKILQVPVWEELV